MIFVTSTTGGGSASSPPPVTLTVFCCGEAAVARTFTVTAMGGKDAPGPNASLRVQCAPVQVQPAPVMDASVRPEETVSVTVTSPLVGVDAAVLATSRV